MPNSKQARPAGGVDRCVSLDAAIRGPTDAIRVAMPCDRRVGFRPDTRMEDLAMATTLTPAPAVLNPGQPGELCPLSDDEAALLYHVGRFGSDGYPVERVGRKWHWRDWLSVRGAPMTYRTKRSATEAFEGWLALARLRWAQMVAAEPGALILTGVGVRRTE